MASRNPSGIWSVATLLSLRTASQVVVGSPAQRTLHADCCGNIPLRTSQYAVIYHRFTAYLIEMLPDDIPKIGPLKTDTTHVVVGDLDKLLQTEQPRMLRKTGWLYLFPSDITQSLHEINDGSLFSKQKRTVRSPNGILTEAVARPTPERKWLKEKTMSVATVIWVDRLSLASSSAGSLRGRLWYSIK